MGPSRFTWPFHSNCTESHTKTNNFFGREQIFAPFHMVTSQIAQTPDRTPSEI